MTHAPYVSTADIFSQNSHTQHTGQDKADNMLRLTKPSSSLYNIIIRI